MGVTIDLPDDVLQRLTAEADRRGVSLAEVVTDLAAQLPRVAVPSGRKFAFIGVGASRAGITQRMDDLLAEGFGRG